jgi:DNA-binding transcriptional MerR regulator
LSLQPVESRRVPDVPEHMSIGRFAQVTGLSIGALRHYAALGLLLPTYVDDQTGYRYYVAAQVDTGRVIATLRELDVPLTAVSAIITGSEADRFAALSAHLARTEAAVTRLRILSHRLRDLTTARRDLLTERNKIMPGSTYELDPADERRIASALFNRVWQLIGKADRSVADEDEMIHAAHASRYHWGVIGTPTNLAVGEWQCSRVYAVLERSEPALHHASRCLTITTENDLGAFHIGCGHEALARAYRVAGDSDRVAEHVKLADAAAADIADAEDRKILTDDLDELR